ncbi:hypothetical protein V2J09_010067 [Rumex salicifolius]
MALLKTMSGHFVSGTRVGFVRSLSRKRILIRSVSLVEESYCSDFDFESDFESTVPAKRRCGDGGDEYMCTDKSVLESLPQELLIKIICGVNHDDLKQLFHVSKSFNEAAKIAKELHFAFATPSKIPAFKSPISPGELNNSSEDEQAPNAPLRKAGRRRFTDKKKEELADVAVSLFRSDSEDSEEERWPRRKLF